MSNTPRIITGILLILAGIALSSVILFIRGSYTSLALGIFSFIIGIVILFNRREDKIEEVRKK